MKILENLKKYTLFYTRFYTRNSEEEFFFTTKDDEWLKGIEDGRFKPSVLIGIKENVEEYELPEWIRKHLKDMITKIGNIKTKKLLFKNSNLSDKELRKFVIEKINKSTINDEDTWDIVDLPEYMKFGDLIKTIDDGGVIILVYYFKNKELMKKYGTDLIVIEVGGKKEYNMVAGDGAWGGPYNTEFLGIKDDGRLQFRVSFTDGRSSKGYKFIWEGKVLLRVPQLSEMQYDILYHQ